MPRSESHKKRLDREFIRTPAELGRLVREHRKRMNLTLQDISETSLLGLRFLSEMERGKENASLGKTLHALKALGLELLILPREEAVDLIRKLDIPDPET